MGIGGIGGLLRESLRSFDRPLARASLKAFGDRPALLTFLFHGLFQDEAEIALGLVDPQQRVTVAKFKAFAQYFLKLGYRFVTPEKILAGLDPQGRHILVTFDDGYFSSFRALPVMRELGIPAVFFISTDQVEEGHCFWWDIYYREQLKAQVSPEAMSEERKALKKRPFNEIESWLAFRFGMKSFLPVGDVDRPVTPAELREFARDPLVHVGNHTVNHAILTTLDAHEARRQIREAQDALEKMTGRRPEFIAYPNGNCSGRIVDLVKEEGLKLGITTRPGKNRLPLAGHGDAAYLLKRFTLDGARDLTSELEVCRSEFSATHTLRNAVKGY